MIVNEESDTGTTAQDNEYILNEIKEYCEFPRSQQFAIMLDGPWGSGKTFLIRDTIRNLEASKSKSVKKKAIYVSLYGARSVSDIEDQIYQQMHPILSHRYTRLAGSILRNLARATVKIEIDSAKHESLSIGPQLPEFDISKTEQETIGRVIIFDDFERAALSPIELLGYINPLVEHDECKVIILSNEEELFHTNKTDLELYHKVKEKTIGKSFRIHANINLAFEGFLANLQTASIGSFLKKYESDLMHVFRNSKTENLRLMKYFLWDFERIWNIFTIEQRKKEEAVKELLLVLCASYLELRSGSTKAAAFRLADLSHAMMMQSSEPDSETTSADIMFKKYPTVNFRTPLLSIGTIVEIVDKSRFREKEIQQQIRNHPYFTIPAKLPSWRALWHSAQLSDEELKITLSQFEDDFRNRKFTDRSEILHVAGLSLWLSDLEFPNWKRESVVQQVKEYIDDIFKNYCGDIDDGKDLSLDIIAGGAFGLGFKNNEDNRFKEISEYARTSRTNWHKRQYDKFALDILNFMKTNSRQFIDEICYTNGGSARYAGYPVLTHLDPKQFAFEFFQLPYDDKNNIIMGLSMRFEQPHIREALISEIPWLTLLYKEVDQVADKMPPIPRHHIKKLISYYLEKYIEK